MPYVERFMIDNGVRCARWFFVSVAAGRMKVEANQQLEVGADLRVVAWDIETTKAPLRFPNKDVDCIMMISLMMDREGYLITNREIVSEDIEDLEYTPLPEYPGTFEVWNEPDEERLLKRFFNFIRERKPHVHVTYNGDKFDWPFVERRAQVYGMDMAEEIGVYSVGNDQTLRYVSRFAIHMDCLYWVKRDAYLPAGSHNLKAVTRKKLHYSPDELSPEDMVPLATCNPGVLASYSVSDAVATYYLFLKYVQPFILSLCMIVPNIPDEVLRKGSGSLCESLLMVQAWEGAIIFPNKHVDGVLDFHNGHVVARETYTGASVEGMREGVFRYDLEMDFAVRPETVQVELLDQVDEVMQFCISSAGCESFDAREWPNYEEVKADIISRLEKLKACALQGSLDQHGRRRVRAKPLIYHLDVSAMYPNIMLTNRLQPSAIKTTRQCAVCEYNVPQEENRCQRVMSWGWRGEIMPPERSEVQAIYNNTVAQSCEHVDPWSGRTRFVPFLELSEKVQADIFRSRVEAYSMRMYKVKKKIEKDQKRDIVCQRENSFFVDTVLSFRDRRYQYKAKLKAAERTLKKAEASDDLATMEVSSKRVVLYDSLQLAHKCILNSFYGYAKRGGSRWYSMEMAGIVCFTGSKIIEMARDLLMDLGQPLEMDTDGIWHTFPAGFPETYKLQRRKIRPDGTEELLRDVELEYPNVLLNIRVDKLFSNDQYQTASGEWSDEAAPKYTAKRVNTIEFELDGPYRAMVLPGCKDQSKRLKKRYVVFKMNGAISELKGFEIKRRGELEILKRFQSEVFPKFLEGSTLEECYEAVGSVGNHCMNILDTQGEGLEDRHLFELLMESKNMSRALDDYGDQKGAAVTTARRLAEFLGDDFVRDAGLQCQYVVSKYPINGHVTDRCVPVKIFEAEEGVKIERLRVWTDERDRTEFSIRDILDWDYYRKRLAAAIQKIVTIPAVLQNVPNPVPRVENPAWLERQAHIRRKGGVEQHSLREYFDVKKEVKTGVVPMDEAERVEREKRASAFDAVAFLASLRRAEETGIKLTPWDRYREALAKWGLYATNNGLTAINESGDSDETEVEEGNGQGVVADTSTPLVHHVAIRDVGDAAARMRLWYQAVSLKWDVMTQKRLMGDINSVAKRTALFHSSHTSGKFGLDAPVGKVSGSLHGSYYQILDLCAIPRRPGFFTLWFIDDVHQLCSTVIELRRTVYINAATEECKALLNRHASVMYRPPHQRPFHTLYRVLFREQTFLENRSELLEIEGVEGIYESKVPLVFGAVTNGVTGIAIPSNDAVRQRIRNGTLAAHSLHLDGAQVDLRYRDAHGCASIDSRTSGGEKYPYLDPKACKTSTLASEAPLTIRVIFLYHALSVHSDQMQQGEGDASRRISAARSGIFGVFIDERPPEALFAGDACVEDLFSLKKDDASPNIVQCRVAVYSEDFEPQHVHVPWGLVNQAAAAAHASSAPGGGQSPTSGLRQLRVTDDDSDAYPVSYQQALHRISTVLKRESLAFSGNRTPTILMIRSPLTRSQITSVLPAVLDFPCVFGRPPAVRPEADRVLRVLAGIQESEASAQHVPVSVGSGCEGGARGGGGEGNGVTIVDDGAVDGSIMDGDASGTDDDIGFGGRTDAYSSDDAGTSHDVSSDDGIDDNEDVMEFDVGAVRRAKRAKGKRGSASARRNGMGNETRLAKREYSTAGWVAASACAMMSFFYGYPIDVKSSVSAARYCNVPLGLVRMDVDWVLWAWDLMYARRLRQKSYLLWYNSTGDKPDLGMYEEDGNMRSVSLEVARGVGSKNMGVFTTFCAYIQMRFVMACAVLRGPELQNDTGIGSDGKSRSNAASRMTQRDGKPRMTATRRSGLDSLRVAHEKAAARGGGSAFGIDASVSVKEGDKPTAGRATLDVVDGDSLSGMDGNLALSASRSVRSDADTIIDGAFGVLRGLVATVMKSARRGSEVLSERLLDGLERWIVSRSSGMHDPALAMRATQLEQLLIQRIEKYAYSRGCGVIQSSSSYLHVSLPCTSYADARRFIDADLLHPERLDSERSSNVGILEHVFFEVGAFFAGGMFVDRSNYAFLSIRDDSAGSQGMLTGEYESEEVVQSSLAQYLPYALRRDFVALLCAYVNKLRDVFIDRRIGDATLPVPRSERDVSALIERQRAAMNEYVAQDVKGNIVRVLDNFASGSEDVMLKQYQRETGGAMSDVEYTFSDAGFTKGFAFDRDGSWVKRSVVPASSRARDIHVDPRVRFVSYVLRHLKLHRFMEKSVGELERTVARHLEVRVNALERFVPPVMPIVVRDVVCEECCAVFEVDLAQDGDGSGPICGVCSASLDLNRLEQRLLVRIDAERMRFYLQDVSPQKGAPFDGCIPAQSEYSVHEYALTEGSGSLEDIMRRFQAVATHYSMRIAQEVVAQLLATS